MSPSGLGREHALQRLRVGPAKGEGQRAVKVQVTLPDGRVADWFRPVAIARATGATVDVSVAFNDPKGIWTVGATDLYTGKTTRTQFRVK